MSEREQRASLGGRVLVTGAAGQLGRSLLRCLAARGIAATGVDIEDFDVTDEGAVLRAVADSAPRWVFHCAAATEVDRCETERAWAEALNAEAPRHVARACKSAGAGLVYYSTDFVFDGRSARAYVEDDERNPLSVYGETKARGEDYVLLSGLERVLVVRTQWLFGRGGRNFPRAILEKARAGDRLGVVDDQVGRPTFSDDLALASVELCERDASGIFHIANQGAMSWFDFAKLCVEEAGIDGVEIVARASGELGLPATRPADSTLDTAKLEAVLGRRMPGVRDALRRYLGEDAEDAADPAQAGGGSR